VVRPTVHGNDAAREPGGVHTITGAVAPIVRASLSQRRAVQRGPDHPDYAEEKAALLFLGAFLWFKIDASSELSTDSLVTPVPVPTG
jgi:hypothetical protein